MQNSTGDILKFIKSININLHHIDHTLHDQYLSGSKENVGSVMKEPLTLHDRMLLPELVRVEQIPVSRWDLILSTSFYLN